MATVSLKQLVFLLGYLLVSDMSLCFGLCPTPLSKCSCQDEQVRCVNTGLQTAAGNEALKAIPPQYTNITFTGNNVTELDANVFGVHPGKPQRKSRINLSGNHIRRIHGKTFHEVLNVIELNLSDNDWLVEHNHARIFTNFHKLKILRLDNTFTRTVNSSFHTTNLSWIFEAGGLDQLEELYLRNNEIWYYPSNTFKVLVTLQILDFSNNILYDPVLKPIHLLNLKELYLSNNSIKTPTKEFMQSLDTLSDKAKLQHVDVSLNPFQCDCNLIDFRDWLNVTNVGVIDKHELECFWPENLRGKKILSLSNEDFVCVPVKPADLNAAMTPFYVVTLVIFCVLGVLLIGLVVMNRRQLSLHFSRLMSRLNISRNRFDYSSVNI